VEAALVEALSTLDINRQAYILMEILAALANVAACPVRHGTGIEDRIA
jgi:hypothetical protein